MSLDGGFILKQEKSIPTEQISTTGVGKIYLLYDDTVRVLIFEKKKMYIH